MWSDRSCINSEMFALREIAIQMRALFGVMVRWSLDSTCDLDKMPRRFSELNHQRQRRNFEGGRY